MPPEKQQLETGELLEDIRYVNQVTKDEIKQINTRIRQRIAEADLAACTADLIVKELSSELGQLSAKVKLTEKAIRSMQPGRKYKYTPVITGKEIGSKSPCLQFGADQLAGNKNLLPIESTGNGIRYLWSSSDPQIQFTFSLDRSKALGMRIHLFAMIKPEYSKQLRLLIDGTYTRHRFSVAEGLFVLSCNLPPSSTTERTEIKIVLPATHSPKELGTSNDERKLGVAIVDISFGKTEGAFAYSLKRLKLKS